MGGWEYDESRDEIEWFFSKIDPNDPVNSTRECTLQRLDYFRNHARLRHENAFSLINLIYSRVPRRPAATAEVIIVALIVNDYFTVQSRVQRRLPSCTTVICPWYRFGKQDVYVISQTNLPGIRCSARYVCSLFGWKRKMFCSAVSI